MICPKCNSNNVRYRENRQNFICDDCDHIFVAEDSNFRQRVFISYGHDEYTEFVIKLADIVKNNDYDVFIDKEGIHYGEHWETNLEDGLKWTKEGKGIGLFLLIMTPHSVRRPDGYCLNEIAYALDLKLKIIPVMLKKVTPPLSIYCLQFFDLSDLPTNSEELTEQNILKIVNVLRNPDVLDSSGGFKTLYNDLNPIGFNSELNLYSTDFVGREWILKEINQWVNTEEKTLIITGMPGIGKSAISTFLYQRMPNVIGFYMFRRNDEEKLSIKQFISTLAFQISSQIPSYRELILHLDIKRMMQNLNKTALFTRLLVEPLSSVHTENNVKLIIIDGLDEAETNGQNTIAQFISQSFMLLPSWIKILVLTRSNPPTVLPFSEASKLKLDAKSDDNIADLRTYINKVRPDTDENTLNNIITRSEGSFLYVKHICKSNLLENAGNLPSGMISFYFNNFSSLFDEEEYKNVRKYLELILGSPRPLSKELIIKATNSNKYEMNAFLNKMHAFIQVVSDNLIKIYHSSLYDWLIDENKSNRFWIDSEKGNTELTEFIEQYLSIPDYTVLDETSQTEQLNYGITLKEIKKKEENAQKEIGIKLDGDLYLLYIDLLVQSGEWNRLLSFSTWYLSLPKSFSQTRRAISDVINAKCADLQLYKGFTSLQNMIRANIKEKVNLLMDNTGGGNPYAMTPYMADLGYFIQELIHIDYSPEWLEILCGLVAEALPDYTIRLLHSGYSHIDGICGMFADEICDLLLELKESGKIKNPANIKWLDKVAR